MTELITAFHYDIGGREVYEDRVNIQDISTPGGLQLTVAVVADGVGGENKGERASQMAMDAFFHYLSTASERDIPTLLIRAVGMANQAVHQIIRETGGASTTMSVAALNRVDDLLFVANVGDSQVYLCRNQQVVQLTLDHTFANLKPWQGEMSRAEAQANPRAEMLMRAIGPRAQIAVDVGFYVNTLNPQIADERGRGGLPLREGDSVLVCSDGLTKTNRRTNQPFVSDEEIIRVLHNQEGEKAARSLVSFALGRDADDNVSAAILQMPDPARHRRARLPFYIASAVAVVVMIIAAILVSFLLLRQSSLEQDVAAVEEEIANVESAANETADAANAIQATGTRAAFERQFMETAEAATQASLPTATPTLTPFPRVALAPDEVGYWYNASGVASPVKVFDSVSASTELVALLINEGDQLDVEPARIFLMPPAKIRLNGVSGDRLELDLQPAGDIFISSGRYVGGVGVSLAAAITRFDVSGSCMAVTYADDRSTAMAACFLGSCSYDIGDGDAAINVGEWVTIDLDAGVMIDNAQISLKSVRTYQTALNRTADGAVVADSCLRSYIPTPTSVPLPTFSPPTDTPTVTPAPSNNGQSGGGNGNNNPPPANTVVPPIITRAPLPSNTPRPPTNTPKPPTSTPQPPTNTPQPPTNTPQPPTNTPPPPTNTPQPPTNTPQPPTNTPQPPTNTPQPPTNTAVPPTNTAVPPTNTRETEPLPETATPDPNA